MKIYYAYIRVSTTRQGEEGVSLQEQRRAVLEFASKRGCSVGEWFEEQISAAKRGRPVFNRMVSQLKAMNAAGVIFHKIDRGARNLRDWADIADLMDRGIDVHFVHESMNLNTRSGRLSADILAVVAADYIRNLRDEVLKGINGRLRQGLFPFAAPVGYTNNGAGKAKTIDPVRGPLIRQAFELYATRKFTLKTLETEMFARGLRTKTGKIVHLSQFGTIMRNPFYIGLIRLKNRKETFPGVHTPLVNAALFNDVQFILDGKRSQLRHSHLFPFRLTIRCENCGLFLVGECQKGHVYYRCHRKSCPRASIREDRFQAAVIEILKKINITQEEQPVIKEALVAFKDNELDVAGKLRRDFESEHERIQQSIRTLLQKFLDNDISKEIFDDGHTELLRQRRTCEDRLDTFKTHTSVFQQTQGYLTGLWSLCERFCTGSPGTPRQILDQVFENITMNGPAIHLKLNPLMEQITKRDKTTKGWHCLLPLIAKESQK